MKKILSLVLVLIFCIAMVGCGSGNQNQEQVKKDENTIVIGLDDSFPPMGYRNENNEIVGFDIDLAKACAEKMGVEVVFQPIAWDSKELELNSGKIDLIWNGFSISEERLASMDFTKPYLNNNMVIVVGKDSKIINKGMLEGASVGVQDGSTALDCAEKDEISKKFNSLNTYDNNVMAFNDLEIGRLDAVVVDEVVARFYIANNSDKGFNILKENFGSEEYAVAAKKGNTELIEKLQVALDELYSDGSAENIAKKWFGESFTF